MEQGSGKDLELKHYMQKLSDTLEDNQDAWFNNPKGWLKRPSFKMTSRRQSLVGGMRGLFQKGGYKLRWFVLDMNTRLLTYYKDDEEGTPENGKIEMSSIETMRTSRATDAPEYAVDLIARDGAVYTLVAESHNSLVRWAFAFDLILNANRSSTGLPSPVRRTASDYEVMSTDPSQSQWVKYDVCFAEKGPLMLNVMGTANRDKSGKIVNSWIVVTSFESHPDGRPGRAETTGQICVKDYLVGVNDTELTEYTFNDAMNAIVGASWPKTIHFLRDNSISREYCRVESWALVFYPSMNRRRRRYCELKGSEISFRKPAPGGSATMQREAFFRISQVAQMRPIVDKTAAADHRFILMLECHPGSLIEHVSDDDVIIGSSPVDVLEMSFAKNTHMNAWRSALVSPVDGVNQGSGITVLPIETLDENSKEAASRNRNVIGVKSYLTGKFAPRELSYVNGVLKWKRAEKSAIFNMSSKEKSIFIVGPAACALQSIKAYDVPSEAKSGYQYQLHIQTSEHTITLGMATEASLLMWLTAISESLSLCPPELLEGVSIPAGIEMANSSADQSKYAEDDEDATYAADTGAATSPTGGGGDDRVVQGYLFKKSASKGKQVSAATDSMSFRKRWFVLKENELYFYKSRSEAQALQANYALGYLDLRTVIEVRESLDDDSPENAIEICTSKQIYLVVAEDEDEMVRWLNALSDAVEYRNTGIQIDNDEDEPGVDDVERIAEIKQNMMHSGVVSLRSVNKITGEASWKERFFAIANNSVQYYEFEGDAYDPDKDCLGEFSLLAVTKIESTLHEGCDIDRTFDIHAHVSRGGDARGIRVFTVMCASMETCMEWMSILCDGTDTLEMVARTDTPGFTSTVSEAALKKRDAAKLVASRRYANMNTVNALKSAAGGEEGGEGRSRVSSVADDAAIRSRATSSAGRGNILSVAGRGRGRGAGLEQRRGSLPLPEEPPTQPNAPPSLPPEPPKAATESEGVDAAKNETAPGSSANTEEGDACRVSQATLSQQRKPQILAGGRGGRGPPNRRVSLERPTGDAL